MATTFRAVLLGICVIAAIGWNIALPVRADDASSPSPPAPPGPGGPSIQPDVPPTYDRIDAGQEAFQRAEAERQQAVRRQLQAIDMNAWYHGLPTMYPYPSLEAVYAYGGRRAYRVAATPIYPRFVYPNVFEPWPLVPGDIYGFPNFARIPQPIGTQTIVIGPGTTLSRPVYRMPMPAVPSPRGAAAQPVPAPTARNVPETIPTPAPVGDAPAAGPVTEPKTQGGPREF